jgi:glycosyltransferase involved in cell wall biosynthesis
MRPTLALCCILKNEIRNLPQLLASVENCFDEIHLTDTGSIDGSLELIQKWIDAGNNPSGCKLFLHHFQWVDDFSKARAASFEPAKTDYQMWMDLDDVLVNRESFIGWRDTVMELGDFWLATYHYAETDDKRPACSFARERVVKRTCEFPWRYFVHEGMHPTSPTKKDVAVQYAATWAIQHKRTPEDLEADKSRNLRLFEKNLATLDARMKYYYGKELYEAGKPLEGFRILYDAVSSPDMELHDRIMGLQYAVQCSLHLRQPDQAIKIAHQALQLAPERAELHCMLADAYVQQGRFNDAVPFFHAAANCRLLSQNSIQGALFSHDPAYTHYPLNQLAKISWQSQNIDDAMAFVDKALAYGPDPESIGIKSELEQMKKQLSFSLNGPRHKTGDIVITGYPNGPYEWDEDIYANEGIGGSETAAVEMARHLSRLTNRKVIVFNNRTVAKHYGNVSYLPCSQMKDYFQVFEPIVHIAWRHNVRLTSAKTYVWCHDLAVPGLDQRHYHKIMALSPFHRDYLKNLYGVPDEKIWVTSNGIEPKRFQTDVTWPEKEPYRVVFSSSPDRGLMEAMLVMDQVVPEYPDATLHVYYGFDNLLKVGRHAEVEHLKKMAAERPYVTIHGNIAQSKLTEELKKSCVWLYPTNFLETYCITAIEMLCAGVYPVVRAYGALPHTLHDAAKQGMASLIKGTDPELYASEVKNAFLYERHRRVTWDPETVSWERVALEWIKEMGL